MHGRVRLLGWLLIVAFPFLLLGAVEGCVRGLDLSPSFARESAIPGWLDKNILVKDARWMEMLSDAPRDLGNFYGTYLWDRHLFYRLKPGVEVALTDALAPPAIRPRTRWTLRTNGRGYPGPEAEPGPHPGVFRILCMGDSSTFGWGVESEESYPWRLGEILRARYPGVPVEVVNLGICGYSSFQGRVLLEREGLAYEPDLITFSYGSNDWSRVPEPFHVAYQRNTGWSGGLREMLHASRAYEIYASWLAGVAGGSWSERVDEARTGDRADMAWNVGPRRSRENIGSMLRTARESGIDPLVVTNCLTAAMKEPVREAARTAEVPLLDTGALLESRIPRLPGDPEYSADRARLLSVYGELQMLEYPSLEVFLADGCHPNVVGHRLLAEALADRVESSPSFRRFLNR